MKPANPFRNNSLVTGATEAEGGSTRRQRFAWVASAVFHVVLLVAMLVLPSKFTSDEADPEKIDIVFYKPEVKQPLEIEQAELIPDPEPQPEPEPEVTLPPEPVVIAEAPPEPPPAPKPVLPKPTPKRQPKPEPVIAKVTPPPAPRKVVKQALPQTTIAKAKPKPRAVTQTGSFGATKREPKAEPRPTRTVAASSFAAESAPTPPPPAPRNRVVAAGSFGGGNVEVPRERPADDRQVVTQASFNNTAKPVEQPRQVQRSVVSTVSFNAEASKSSARRTNERSVNEGGFGAVENTVAKGSKRTLPTGDPDTPVEIVSKPKPAYTDEARDLRVEGEVVLKVTFTDTGILEILGVVDGLGHGLDEAAIEAAKQIKFTPARREGRPVDHTATLRVVFRLA